MNWPKTGVSILIWVLLVHHKVLTIRLHSLPCRRVHSREDNVYQFTWQDIHEKRNISLSEFRGKILIIVNTASYSALTWQYVALNKLKEQYGQYGFEILGFPCNQFNLAEQGSNGTEILHALKYVRPGKGFEPNFVMLKKAEVNGENAIDIFTYLKIHCPSTREYFFPRPLLFYSPFSIVDIRWNFESFLIDRRGQPLIRYDCTSHPASYGRDIERIIKLSRLRQEKLKKLQTEAGPTGQQPKTNLTAKETLESQTHKPKSPDGLNDDQVIQKALTPGKGQQQSKEEAIRNRTGSGEKPQLHAKEGLSTGQANLTAQQAKSREQKLQKAAALGAQQQQSIKHMSGAAGQVATKKTSPSPKSTDEYKDLELEFTKAGMPKTLPKSSGASPDGGDKFGVEKEEELPGPPESLKKSMQDLKQKLTVKDEQRREKFNKKEEPNYGDLGHSDADKKSDKTHPTTVKEEGGDKYLKDPIEETLEDFLPKEEYQRMPSDEKGKELQKPLNIDMLVEQTPAKITAETPDASKSGAPANLTNNMQNLKQGHSEAAQERQDKYQKQGDSIELSKESIKAPKKSSKDKSEEQSMREAIEADVKKKQHALLQKTKERSENSEHKPRGASPALHKNIIQSLKKEFDKSAKAQKAPMHKPSDEEGSKKGEETAQQTKPGAPPDLKKNLEKMKKKLGVKAKGGSEQFQESPDVNKESSVPDLDKHMQNLDKILNATLGKSEEDSEDDYGGAVPGPPSSLKKTMDDLKKNLSQDSFERKDQFKKDKDERDKRLEGLFKDDYQPGAPDGLKKNMHDLKEKLKNEEKEREARFEKRKEERDRRLSVNMEQGEDMEQGESLSPQSLEATMQDLKQRLHEDDMRRQKYFQKLAIEKNKQLHGDNLGDMSQNADTTNPDNLHETMESLKDKLQETHKQRADRLRKLALAQEQKFQQGGEGTESLDDEMLKRRLTFAKTKEELKGILDKNTPRVKRNIEL